MITNPKARRAARRSIAGHFEVSSQLHELTTKKDDIANSKLCKMIQEAVEDRPDLNPRNDMRH